MCQNLFHEQPSHCSSYARGNDLPLDERILEISKFNFEKRAKNYLLNICLLYEPWSANCNLFYYFLRQTTCKYLKKKIKKSFLNYKYILLIILNNLIFFFFFFYKTFATASTAVATFPKLSILLAYAFKIINSVKKKTKFLRISY